MKSLKRTQITRIKSIEESRKLLIKIFIGNYFHDELNINVHNVHKVTINCTTTSKIFKSKQLELQQPCINLEHIKDFKSNNNVESRKLAKKTSFHQEDKILRDLLNTPKFRTVTCIKDKERCYGKMQK